MDNSTLMLMAMMGGGRRGGMGQMLPLLLLPQLTGTSSLATSSGGSININQVMTWGMIGQNLPPTMALMLGGVNAYIGATLFRKPRRRRARRAYRRFYRRRW